MHHGDDSRELEIVGGEIDLAKFGVDKGLERTLEEKMDELELTNEEAKAIAEGEVVLVDGKDNMKDATIEEMRKRILAVHDPKVGPEPPDDRSDLGATGKFPEGKLNPNDEGEIKFAVGHTPDFKKVVLDFGTPVAWLGMDPRQALGIARSLKAHARKCLNPQSTGTRAKKRRKK